VHTLRGLFTSTEARSDKTVTNNFVRISFVGDNSIG
jgi:hypothetical protein